jgi:hypothetical protein
MKIVIWPGCVFVMTRLVMRFPHFLFMLLLSVTLAACSSANRLLKARPAGLSPFFEQPSLAQDARGHLPFQVVWTTPDPRVLAESTTRKKLHVAPVTLAYLRPVSKALASREIAWGVHRQEAAVATRLREEFVAAFRRSPQARYKIVDKPGADTLTLRLAVIELSPTSPKGNAIMTLLKFAVTPAAVLGRWFTKGNMAIEGKVVDSRTGRVFFQFADHESDKLTFLNTRDYQPYGHAVNSMRDWAVQFEQMTRTPSGLRIKDSSSITLRPN